ncbi:MAG: PG0541 family transporter-associated protein [Thermovirgaceae bacterium]
MLWILCNESIGEDVSELLDSAGARSYTVWTDVLGKDNEGDKTHWGTSVFPGKNWAFMICDDCGCVDEIIERLKELKKQNYVRQAGLKALVQVAEEALPDSQGS